jgi:catechol-2,3-dioxygenase
MTLPNMTLTHMGIAVKNMREMEAFYTEVLGFKASDRGVVRGAPIVFLTRDPLDHHQIVFQEQRKPDDPTTINQISFQLDDLDGLRKIKDALVKARVKELKLVDHCLAWSVYCHDPEGNRLEFFVDAPYYVNQPMIQELNLDQSDEAIVEATKARFSSDPSFCTLAEWRERFAQDKGAGMSDQ